MRDEHLTEGNSALCLMSSGTPALVTGTIVETTLAEILIPAGIVGPHTHFRLWHYWQMTNNANNKTVRTRFNGTLLGASAGLSANAAYAGLSHWFNRGALNSQLFWGNGFTLIGSTASPMLAGTVNFGAEVLLTLTAQLANAGDSITLEGWALDLVNPL